MISCIMFKCIPVLNVMPCAFHWHGFSTTYFSDASALAITLYAILHQGNVKSNNKSLLSGMTLHLHVLRKVVGQICEMGVHFVRKA